MKFCWTTLNVNNMEESLTFYQEVVGLKLERRFNMGPSEIAFLGEGETKVELICNADREKVQYGQDISLGFTVKSVDETIAFVNKRGIELLGGPYQPNPRVRFFYILDPNGLKIQFVEDI